MKQEAGYISYVRVFNVFPCDRMLENEAIKIVLFPTVFVALEKK